MNKIKAKNINNVINIEDDRIISFSDIFLFFAQHIKIILIVPFISSLLSIIYVKNFSEPYFISVSKFKSSSESSQDSQVSGLAAQFGINLGGGNKNQDWVYPSIIKSRTLAKKMISRNFTTLKYGPQKSLLQILTYGNNNPMFSEDTLVKIAINNFIPMVSIIEDAMSGIYSMEVTSFEPKFSYEINLAIVEELNTFLRNSNRQKNNKAKQFVAERISQTEKELQLAEEELKKFRERNRRIENSPSLNLIQERLSREVFVLTNVFTTLKQQFETIKIEEVKKLDYVVVLDEAEIPLHSSGPNNRLIVFISGVLGIFFGCTIATFRSYLEKRDKIDIKKHNLALDIAKENIKDLFLFGKK